MLPLESLFRDLNDRGGRYVLVGGLAAVLHGHLRATGDVDLIVDLDPDQVTRTLSALQTAGFQPYVPVPAEDFADPAKRTAWAREKGMMVFSLRPAGGIPMVDLFLEHPLPFDQLWTRSVTINLRGVPIRVASIDDLIALSPTSEGSGRFPPEREALLRSTLALSVDQRVAWLEQMMAIAMESGALPKRIPDQLAGARSQRDRHV